ncbi:MAG: L-seryl-tRNA(Sec) selenium transferase [Ruminococcaceae bacterium]|nr:L-seryl-tRNA(Sec) selenium transferase [Oscillospiraceae bacterium]
MNQQLLRKLPKVDELLRAPAVEALRGEHPEQTVTDAVRKVIGNLRQGILNGQIDALPDQETLFAQIAGQIRSDVRPSMRTVINGTGIVLHTNLGRACLSEKAAQAASDAARRYSTLEYNVSTGGRGLRYSHVEELICRLTGAESALVVNNNAAAVLLVLSSMTTGGQVPVSRGELVEIGGSFRVPDIMEACGAQLKEVGTTNKTHLFDYERAICPETKALMKVHTSNYRIVGFTEKPTLAEMVELGHKYNLPVIEDLGSGSLVNLEQFGLHDEPTVQDSIRAGVDVVSFSGDKLLGGPQAGIIIGKKQYVDKMKKHPLTRAMRVDKMTLAALESTLRSYDNGTWSDIPTMAMLSASADELKEKAGILCDQLNQAGIPAQLAAVEGQVGGGSVPTQTIPSWAVALEGAVEALEEKLRLGETAIVGRIHNDRYLLDARTLWVEDFPTIVRAVKEALA